MAVQAEVFRGLEATLGPVLWHYAMKMYGIVEIKLRILNLCTVRTWVVSITLRPSYPRRSTRFPLV
jgi:hypothetical protein